MTELADTLSTIELASNVFRRRPSREHISSNVQKNSRHINYFSAADPIKGLVSKILGKPIQHSPPDLRSDLEALKKCASVLIDAKQEGTLTDDEASKLLELFVEGFAHRRINDVLNQVVVEDDDDVNWFYASAKSKRVHP